MEKKKLKIALVNDSFYPIFDGVTKAVDSMAKCLCKLFDVVVVVPDYEKNEENINFYKSLPYKVLTCKHTKANVQNYRMSKPNTDKAFQNHFSEENFDIIQINSVFPLCHFALSYALKNKIPCFCVVHSKFKPDLKQSLKLNFLVNIFVRVIIVLLNKCSGVFSLNNKMDSYIRKLGYKGKSEIIPNGTDFCFEWENIRLVEKLKKNYNIEHSTEVFLFVGRFISGKGVNKIIEALNIYKQYEDDFRMIFVGFGPEEEKMKRLIKKFNLEDNVFVAERTVDPKELCAYYTLADLFLFPSTYDTDGIVKREAAAMKVPTLMLKDEFSSSDISDNSNGFLCKNSKEEIAQRIKEIMANKKVLYEVGENAYKTLYIKWEDIANRYHEFYKNKLKI
ncbi:MAG: glycosyltransferase [Clostridia bacterium]